MRIVFMGSNEFSVTVLDALLCSRHNVLAAVCQPDRPSGRGRRIASPPVKEFAKRRNLAVHQPENVNEPDFVRTLSQLKPDIICVASFGQFLGKKVLELPQYGCVNVHPSLLPRYRGAAPCAHAIINGDSESGVTIYRMVRQIDAGPIIQQKTYPISSDDTSGSLSEKLASVGAQLLLESLESIGAGKVVYTPQDENRATLAPALSKSDGLIDWNSDAVAIERKIRAFRPWPLAFTYIVRADERVGLRMSILSANVQEHRTVSSLLFPPGTIVQTGSSISVQTGKNVLAILTRQPSGRLPMSASEFLNGYRLKIGDMLGKWAPENHGFGRHYPHVK